ncbi:MAG: hypothetical protein P4L58_00900, partial [Candidatus Pacebacteria bacterium]|nr:hypothetical protein [Candidatus Paceibacterota bacterium]
SGDTVTLYDPDGNMIDSHKYSASDVRQGKSIARVPDGTGDWIDPIPTPGAKNTKKNSDRFMRHYYRDACFDKKGDPQCAEDFLKNLGLWIDKMPDKTDDASNNTSDHSDANTPPEAPENGGISQDNPPAGDGAPDGYHRGQWKADGNGANQSENGWQSRQRTGTQPGSHAWTAGQHFQRTFDSASAGN